MPDQPIEELSESIESIELQEKIEENVSTEQIEVEEKVFAEVEAGMNFNTVEINAGREEPIKFVNKYKEKSESENLFRQLAEVEAKEPLKAVVDKDLIEKVARDYIKSYLEREIESLKNSVKKNRMLSFILFVVSLVLILTLYFIK
jgi:Zn-dependent metalloprotease